MTERTSEGNISLGKAFKEVINAGKQNMEKGNNLQGSNLKEMRDTTLELMEGGSSKAERKIEELVKKREADEKKPKKGKGSLSDKLRERANKLVQQELGQTNPNDGNEKNEKNEKNHKL